jgi:phosphate butyryltransferase
LISLILIGKEVKIRQLLAEMNEDAKDYIIINHENERDCAAEAMKQVASGSANLPMKGNMQTSTFMRAILDKQYSYVPERGLLSQASIVEFTQENRLLIISDCAVNIAPTYEEKIKIINNAVSLAKRLGVECPKVAVITPLEMVNPAMPCTVEAAMLSKAAERGQIPHCIVDGPLALDNAISAEAAAHKGIKSQVAGYADILIMPDINTGNVLAKSLTHFANLPVSGTLLGTNSPVIVASRTDSAMNKFYSILSALI